jgi:hypothetical protein
VCPAYLSVTLRYDSASVGYIPEQRNPQTQRCENLQTSITEAGYVETTNVSSPLHRMFVNTVKGTINLNPLVLGSS